MNSPVDKDYVDSRLEAIMALFHSEMAKYQAQNAAEHADLKTRIEQSESRIIKWVAGIMLAQSAVMLSAMSLMFHSIMDRAPTIPPSPPPPVVINIPAPTAPH